VQIEWVELVDFRSYRSLSFAPGPSLNVLAGDNAQGKTNLVEALGVFLVGRSFRGARAAELVRWEAAAAGLSGLVRRGETSRSMRRRIERRDDGPWMVAGDGCAWVRAVPFAWPDLAIISGAPQARRAFLDGFAAKLFPAHAAACSRYRQVLARRNHLLQAGLGVGELSAQIAPWDEQLAVIGIELRSRREAAVAALSAELGPMHAALGGPADVGLGYRPSPPEDCGDAAGFRERLAARQRDEARRGQTLIGPHRDDVDLFVGGRDARTFASRGQQRLLALALRLAEARGVARAVGSPPVLLLDDAMSELDRETQERVAQHVAGAGQVFLTTAERAIPVPLATWWDVRGGGVTQSSPSRIRGAA
jgi:DNA replication and repair protein RecF